MTDLLLKHVSIASRFEKLSEHSGSIGVVNDRILSPTRAVIEGRETILAGTNNYMGLTFESACIEAGCAALESYGTGTTGSRIANGTYGLHTALEGSLADFLCRRHCIIYSTGYQANLGMITGLAGAGDTIFLDSDSHASIYDGCLLSGAHLVRFRHNDASDLRRRLDRWHRRSDKGSGGCLVIIEGIYSILGDRVPLADFVALKSEYAFQLLVDEAHSFGALGENGRGVCEEAGCEDGVDFILGTFSKSMGSIGGFGVGDHDLFETLRYASRSYMFTASPSPSSVATAHAALSCIAAEPERRVRLRENYTYLHGAFRSLGLDLGCSVPGPIIAVRVLDEDHCVGLWGSLLRAGVYVNMAIPPGTPSGESVLRCSVSSAHSREELDHIVRIFAEIVPARAA